MLESSVTAWQLAFLHDLKILCSTLQVVVIACAAFAQLHTAAAECTRLGDASALMFLPLLALLPRSAFHTRGRIDDMLITRAAVEIMGSPGCVLSPAAAHPSVGAVPITAACPGVLSCFHQKKHQL
jgi:hypothetical protein